MQCKLLIGMAECVQKMLTMIVEERKEQYSSETKHIQHLPRHSIDLSIAGPICEINSVANKPERFSFFVKAKFNAETKYLLKTGVHCSH